MQSPCPRVPGLASRWPHMPAAAVVVAVEKRSGATPSRTSRWLAPKQRSDNQAEPKSRLSVSSPARPGGRNPQRQAQQRCQPPPSQRLPQGPPRLRAAGSSWPSSAPWRQACHPPHAWQRPSCRLRGAGGEGRRELLATAHSTATSPTAPRGAAGSAAGPEAGPTAAVVASCSLLMMNASRCSQRLPPGRARHMSRSRQQPVGLTCHDAGQRTTCSDLHVGPCKQQAAIKGAGSEGLLPAHSKVPASFSEHSRTRLGLGCHQQ